MSKVENGNLVTKNGEILDSFLHKQSEPCSSKHINLFRKFEKFKNLLKPTYDKSDIKAQVSKVRNQFSSCVSHKFAPSMHRISKNRSRKLSRNNSSLS